MRLTLESLQVLGVLVAREGGYAGAELSKRLGIGHGTVYPILYRLEQEKWATGRWERGNPRTLGRPLQRFYTLTPLGETQTLDAFQRLELVWPGRAWRG